MSDIPKPSQLRGARAMLGWSMVELASKARVSVLTIKRIETEDIARVAEETIASIAGRLVQEGVTFIADDGSGAGIRVRQS